MIKMRLGIAWLALVVLVASCATNANEPAVALTVAAQEGVGAAVRTNVAVAAQDDEPFAEPSPEPVVAVVDPGGASVINAGAEPLELLQLTPEPGTVQRLIVTQSGRQEIYLADEPTSPDRISAEFPPTELQVKLTVLTSDATGTSVSLAIEAATVAGVPAEEMLNGDADIEADPLLAREAASLLAGMQGQSSVLNLDRQGRMTSAEPLVGDGVSYETVVLGYVERRFLTVADPLPQQPLGVGAEWSMSSLATAKGHPGDGRPLLPNRRNNPRVRSGSRDPSRSLPGRRGHRHRHPR